MVQGSSSRVSEFTSKDPKDFHLLIIGGKARNIPVKRLKCKFTQIDQEEASGRNRDQRFSMVPDIVLVIKDFVSHSAYYAYKEKARSLGVPFVASSGGFNAIVTAAKVRGYDLSKYILDARTSVKSIKITKPVEVKPMISESAKQKWISRIPRVAKEATVKSSRKVWVLKNPKGTLSLVFKGTLLNDALKIVKKRNYGSAKRGMLSAKEAEALITELDADYGFRAQNFNLTSKTVRDNIGYVQGNVSPSVAARISGKNKRRKKFKKAPEKTLEVSKSKKPEPVLENPVKISESAQDTFFAELAIHIRKMDEAREHQQKLYQQIADLIAENTSFMDQIAHLEKKIMKLEEDLASWKILANKK